MKLSAVQSTLRSMKADAVALFTTEEKKAFQESLSPLRKHFGKKIDSLLALEAFSGKAGEVASLPTESKLASPRLFIAGLGPSKTLTLEQFRRAAAAVSKKAARLGVRHLAVL